MHRFMTCVMACAIFAVVALGALSSTPTTAVEDSFYFESHGRDDIREWRAALIKGAQYLKVDFNFVHDANTCSRMRRAVPDPSGGFPNGCFVLSHYVNPNQTNYNSSFDVVAFINDTAQYDVLMQRPVIIQMCLKNLPGPLCGGVPNATLANMWLALMDDFHALAAPIALNKLAGNVRFVFDSLDPFRDNCTVSRWSSFDITWTGGPYSFATPDAAATSPWVARYQMVNMQWDDPSWQRFIPNGFFRFANAPYAFVGWEPADEWKLRAFYAQFQSYNFSHKLGIISAYNADPAMWHVLTSPSTKRFNHDPVGHVFAKTPVMTYIDETKTLVTLALRQLYPEEVTYTLHTRTRNGRFALASEGSLGRIHGIGSRLTSVAATRLGGGNFAVVLVSEGACWTGLILSTANGSSTLTQATTLDCTSIRSAMPGPAHNISVAVRGDDADGFISFVAAARVNNSVIMQQFVPFTWPPPQQSSSLTAMGPSVRVTHVADWIHINDGLALHWAADPRTNGTQRVVVVSWAVARMVFASVVVVPSIGGTPVTVTPDPGAEWFHLGTGRHPTVFVHSDARPFTPYTPAPRVLIAYGQSFCYNSELVDDSALMMFGVMVCDLNRAAQVEITEEPVNSYVFGEIDSLEASIAAFGAATAAGTAPLWGWANTCDDALFHGVFDLGYTPSVALLRADPTNDPSAVSDGFIAVAALVSLESQAVSTCGNPLPHNGQVIIDSFPLMGQPLNV